MRAADCILSKAGGLTFSEALACGLLLILVVGIPGQETGNANYVVSGNAGLLDRDPIKLLMMWLISPGRRPLPEKGRIALL